MDNLYCLAVLILCSYTLAVKINDLVVPRELQNGTHTNIVLDCKFELQNENDTDSLVIQWFFQDQILIYQWIPREQEPRAIGTFKDRIDVKYRVNDDPYTKYRALKLIKVAPDLTGRYTCVVSNFKDEAIRTKEMVIYEPPKEFVFYHHENSSELLCSAYNVSPKPTITIYAYERNLTGDADDNEVDSDSDLDVVELPNGLYNVSKIFRYTSEITEPTVFACELRIPNTHYRRILNETFYPEGEPTTTTSDYDYETTTISPTPGNSELVRSSRTILLSTFLLTFMLRQL